MTAAAARRARFESEILPLLPAAYRTARRLTHRQEDAEDLVQETCLRAFRTFDRFVAGTSGKAWLFTILYSVFINRYRRQQRAPALLSGGDIDARYFEHAAHEAPPAQSWTEPEVEEALALLPEPFRAAVLLVDLEELTYEEAAVALRCPVGTVRSRLFRGRKQLMVALTNFARRAGYLRGEGPPPEMTR